MTSTTTSPSSTWHRIRHTGVRHGIALLAILLINGATFWSHYAGSSTFPWDFIGGYHAQSVAWFEADGAFSGRAWLPWADMGFPGYLAIQSGAWYLPMMLLSALGVPYTFQVATVLQALHVVLGAFGAYLLLLRWGTGRWLALLGGLAYHFSGAFFSGGQFSDIVRAASLLPWILLVIRPDLVMRSRFAPLIASLLLGQFLIVAYPGNVVATVYACGVVAMFGLCFELEKGQRRAYLVRLAVIVAAGVLMSMPKWYPLLAKHGQLDYQVMAPNALEPKLWLTLLLPYDVDSLPGDLSMRSLWLPVPILVGLCFVRLKQRQEQLPLALFLLGVVMASLVPLSESLTALLPGARLSRFPVSDYRPLIQLSLIALSVMGWRNLLSGQFSDLMALFRASLALAAMLAWICAAILLQWNSGLLLHATFAVGLVAPLVVLTCVIAKYSVSRQATIRFAALALGVVIVGDAVWYQYSQPRTWRVAWSGADEAITFGNDVDALLNEGFARQGKTLARRPARYVHSLDPAEALRTRTNPVYNRCWYSRTFCLLGYNNLRLSPPHSSFLRGLASPSGADLLEFGRRPQQLYVVEPTVHQGALETSATSFDDGAVGPSASALQVAFKEYSPTRIVYDLQASRAVRVVENEIWWPDWRLQACKGTECLPERTVDQTAQGLRSWTVEPGTWRVTLRFIGVDYRIPFALFAVGLLLPIGFLLLAKRRPGL